MNKKDTETIFDKFCKIVILDGCDSYSLYDFKSLCCIIHRAKQL